MGSGHPPRAIELPGGGQALSLPRQEHVNPELQPSRLPRLLGWSVSQPLRGLDALEALGGGRCVAESAPPWGE